MKKIISKDENKSVVFFEKNKVVFLFHYLFATSYGLFATKKQ